MQCNERGCLLSADEVRPKRINEEELRVRPGSDLRGGGLQRGKYMHDLHIVVLCPGVVVIVVSDTRNTDNLLCS